MCGAAPVAPPVAVIEGVCVELEESVTDAVTPVSEEPDDAEGVV